MGGFKCKIDYLESLAVTRFSKKLIAPTYLLILIDSHTLENRGLAVLTLIVCVLGLLTLTHNRNPFTEVILPSSQNDQG